MPLTTANGALKLITYLGIRNRGQLLLIDYVVPPNPDKAGWWIPAPELGYGDDPYELAQAEAGRLGFSDVNPHLMDVESFTMGEGNWHFIVHFVLDVSGDPVPSDNIRRWKWAAPSDLPDASSFAHKRWESELAKRMLGFRVG
jgi:hypothetical protein